VYDFTTADRLAGAKGWTFAADGRGLRRVVPSPIPQRILGVRQIETLLGDGCVVVCTGGGGVPVASHARRLVGVDGVIDKDRASSLLAGELCADAFIIATDVDAVYEAYGTPAQRVIGRASPAALASWRFTEGSMGPKVEAACAFAEREGCFAAIGALRDASRMLAKTAGTIIEKGADGIEFGLPARAPADTGATDGRASSGIPQ
jgi:carbamate kinase